MALRAAQVTGRDVFTYSRSTLPMQEDPAVPGESVNPGSVTAANRMAVHPLAGIARFAGMKTAWILI